MFFEGLSSYFEGLGFRVQGFLASRVWGFLGALMANMRGTARVSKFGEGGGLGLSGFGFFGVVGVFLFRKGVSFGIPVRAHPKVPAARVPVRVVRAPWRVPLKGFIGILRASQSYSQGIIGA